MRSTHDILAIFRQPRSGPRYVGSDGNLLLGVIKMTERVLSLDMSTKTGWALLVSSPTGYVLEGYGTITKIDTPDEPYPGSYVTWAYLCFGEIVRLIDNFAPDVLVIEETSKGSKNNLSQKILEFIHFLVARMIKETGIKAVYMMTEQWRREVGCSKMSDADKKRNKEVREYKKKNKTKIARDKDGKVIGLIGKKHLNVRRANEVFGDQLSEPLIMKDEDTADSLLLAYAYHLRKVKNV
jgi:hypothetical protein